jgi:hypothetical protein
MKYPPAKAGGNSAGGNSKPGGNSMARNADWAHSIENEFECGFSPFHKKEQEWKFIPFY